MSTVGLRELRQDASELVRRVENGEEIEIKPLPVDWPLDWYPRPRGVGNVGTT